MNLKEKLSTLHSKFVLLIGDEGAILIYVEKNSVARRLFAPSSDKEHIQALVKLFEAFPEVPIYILVDMIDQSYVRHALPPVTPLGLGKLIKRRLERDFAKDDIKGALPLGRRTEGRKDWDFLLISLANSPQLQGWLNVVYELPNRLRGIYLVPVEAELLIAGLSTAVRRRDGHALPEVKKKLALPFKKKKDKAEHPPEAPGEPKAPPVAEWQVLVSHHKIGGFRQVVVKNGRLVFTRLAQGVADTSAQVAAGNVEQEILNTIEYLKRLSYTPKSGLEVFIMVEQDIKDAISNDRIGATQLHVLTPFEAAELLDLKQAVLSGDRYGDVVVAAMFGVAKKHRLRLDTEYSKRLNMLYSARIGVKATAACVGVVLLGAAVANLFSMHAAYQNIGILETEAEERKQTLASLRASADDLPAEVEEVTDLVALHELIHTPRATPFEVVRRLRELTADNMLLQSFGWTEEEAPANSSGGTPPPSQEPAAPQYKIEMNVEFTYDDPDWEAYIARIKNFLSGLQAMYPDYQMEHSLLPGEQSDTGLRVSFSEVDKDQAFLEYGDKYNMQITLSGPKPKTETPPGT